MSSTAGLRSLMLNLLLLTVVTAVTLVIADVAMIAAGVFPPTQENGHATVGWLAVPATGDMHADRCLELEADTMITYTRNEDAIRTSQSATVLRERGDRFEAVVSGDSHTDLCAANELTHFGFTESALRESGVESHIYAFGSGKYSPLQAYLAIEPFIRDYAPDSFILNLYTGNDFYDMMRVDDRPHFVADGDGYRIADPVWYRLAPPGTVRRSRVLYAFRQLGDAVGVRNVLLRVRYLRQVAAEQGEGLPAVLGYMSDLRKAAAKHVGYPQAFSAQMLNQQLFFNHFPDSKEESVRRVRALLALIRERHPQLLLVLSPIPSYQLVLGSEPDSVLSNVLTRLPIEFAGGVAEEQELYDRLRGMSVEHGWEFVDNLTPMRAAPDRRALFNHFDYHIQPAASEIIGREQAAQLRALLSARPAPPVTADR